MFNQSQAPSYHQQPQQFYTNYPLHPLQLQFQESGASGFNQTLTQVIYTVITNFLKLVFIFYIFYSHLTIRCSIRWLRLPLLRFNRTFNKATSRLHCFNITRLRMASLSRNCYLNRASLSRKPSTSKFYPNRNNLPSPLQLHSLSQFQMTMNKK